MKTTRLYQQDRYIKEWDAQITSVTEDNGSLIVTLDKSAFFPEGGGQSCDLGMMGDYEVIDVQEKDEEVYHKVKPAEGENSADGKPAPLQEGDAVHCVLDWVRRFDNMQRHCGEHILSGIFFALFGGVNRGFHMGQDYMTVDISLEEDPDVKEITYEDALRAELEANKVIWADEPVTVMHFESREEAEKMPLRKALAFDEDITIVSVGSIENAADCVACCGTHPNTAGQVGLIKIYKVENYKGMFRIYFEAGARALNDYRAKHNILTELSNKYSSSIEDFPSKLRAQEEKLADAKSELHQIKKAFTDNECAKLDALMAEAGDDSKVTVYEVEQLGLDDVFNMAKRYMGSCKGLIMLYSIKDTSYILVSDGSIDCGGLVKEYASFYKGKGGGNKVSARSIFTSKEDAEMFADLVQKHLK
ncbi:MAG: alanyl-tRNA editing protein [Firmicutes bacterium]|nr:alanyl-tRNA editing protein [Bacillota bacterium]